MDDSGHIWAMLMGPSAHTAAVNGAFSEAAAFVLPHLAEFCGLTDVVS